MEYLKLIGILIIVVGFALKWDVIAVVLIDRGRIRLFNLIRIPQLSQKIEDKEQIFYDDSGDDK